MFNTYRFLMKDANVKEYLLLDQRACYEARAKAYAPRFIWSDLLKPVWNACLVHSSANVPGKIAYFASIDNMMANRLTRTSPEMFLERFLNDAPDEIVAAWKVEVLGQLLPTVQFIENTDPDGWFNIYASGPQSCMKGSPRVKQYAYPMNDLALAYIEKDGVIVNRTIVNKATKRYVRIYSREDGVFMASALNKLGYKQDQDALAGQRIHARYEECRCCEETFLVAPYIDGDNGNIQIDDNNSAVGIISNDGEEAYYDEDFTCRDCGCE